MKQQVNIKKLDDRAVIPTYGTAFSAGADLYACMDGPVTIAPGETYLVHTGISVAVPEGYAGLIYARIGLATKKGLAPANKVGVIDADYRGEIMVALHNHSAQPAEIDNGERIAQMVITPFLTEQIFFHSICGREKAYADKERAGISIEKVFLQWYN